jgi:pentapeptide MXKDX repeat protein
MEKVALRRESNPYFRPDVMKTDDAMSKDGMKKHDSMSKDSMKK